MRTPLSNCWSRLATKAKSESKERFPEGMCKHEEHELEAHIQLQDFLLTARSAVQQQVERSAAKLQALLQSVAQSSRIRTSAQGVLCCGSDLGCF